MPSLAPSLGGVSADPQTAVNTAAIAANTASITGLTARLDNRDQKDSVRAVATSNVTISGAQTIDGVALVNNDRVGVIGQTLGATNGIYVVGTPWTRATDADTSAKVTNGMYFFVEEGTLGKGLAYELTTPNPIVLGTTALTFAHFAGSLKASEISNDSSVSGTTSKDALNTLGTAVGAGSLAVLGTSGVAATNLIDAVNELAALSSQNSYHMFSRPSSTASSTGGGTSGLGIVVTASGSPGTIGAPTDTNYLTRRLRYNMPTTATALQITGADWGLPSFSAPFNRNTGFTAFLRFGFSAVSANMRWFCGFRQGTSAPTNVAPESQLNIFGFGSNAQANVQFLSNDNSGSATPVDLGASFPAQTLNVCYEACLICPLGGSTLYYRLRRLDSAAVVYGSVSADLIVASTYGRMEMWISNNTDASIDEINWFGTDVFVPF